MLRNRDRSDVLLAIAIIAFGLFIVHGGLALSIGTPRRIGPGFFPLGLGAIIALLGLGVLFEPQPAREDGPPNWRGLTLISLALAAFAALVETLGLFPAIAALVLLTALADRAKIRPLTLIGLIIGLCAAGYLLFVLALRLPFQPFLLP